MTAAELGDQNADDSAMVRQAVADNMRRARLAKGISLRELAASTGLSAALLSQIERQSANPTVSTLTRLAGQLGISFSDLTRARLTEPEIIRAGPDGPLPRVRTLFDMHERRRFDISEGVLPPGEPGSFGSHGAGTVEHVYVVAGRATLVVGERSWELAVGDSARFDSSVDHSYTTQDEGATLLTIVAFRED